MRPLLTLLFAVSTLAVVARTAQAQDFILDNNALDFTAIAGTSPAVQTVKLTNNTANQLQISFSVRTQDGGQWLAASISNPVLSGQTVAITVMVSPSNLSLGLHLGIVTVSDGNPSSDMTIQVNLTVIGSFVTISAPSSKNVTLVLGSTTSLSIPVTGGPVTVQIQSTAGWLMPDRTVDVPGDFSVTVDASLLTVGMHSGVLTLQCAPGGSPCVPVSVIINATVTATSLINAVVGAGLSVPPVTGISANALITIFGTNLAARGTSRNVIGSDLVNGALPANLANTCVQGGSARWGVIYVSDTQINAVANPLSVSGTLPVSVITNCDKSNQKTTAPFDVAVAAETPQFLFFVQDPSGQNEVVALEASSGAKVGPPGLLPADTTTPAHAGDVLTAYGVSWGATTPAAVVGSLAAHAATILGDHSLTIGGVRAQVSYAGLAPNFAGLYQLNFTVPSGLSPGKQPIVFVVNGVSTPAGAYLAIR